MGTGEGSEERSRYTETGLAVGYLRSWQLLRMSRNSLYHPLSTHPSKHPPSPPKIYPLLSPHLISSSFFTYWLRNKRRGYNIFFDVVHDASIVAVFTFHQKSFICVLWNDNTVISKSALSVKGTFYAGFIGKLVY